MAPSVWIQVESSGGHQCLGSFLSWLCLDLLAIFDLCNTEYAQQCESDEISFALCSWAPFSFSVQFLFARPLGSNFVTHTQPRLRQPNTCSRRAIVGLIFRIDCLCMLPPRRAPPRKGVFQCRQPHLNLNHKSIPQLSTRFRQPSKIEKRASYFSKLSLPPLPSLYSILPKTHPPSF